MCIIKRNCNVLKDKYEQLQSHLKSMKKVIVAYSGGVDSAFLMKAAFDTLGNDAIAVLASSELHPYHETQSAIDLSKQIGFRLIHIQTNELDNEQFTRNLPDRCYHCKKSLFKEMQKIAVFHGYEFILHGANADDIGDFRPGHAAADELGIKAPLQELGFTKDEIRQLSKELNLPTWNKPSFACLSSRFPYNTTITRERLANIDKAEETLRLLGFEQYRVRHHNEIARIEIPSDDMHRLLDHNVRDKIVSEFKNLGYLYVTMDIKGYRTGSMNEKLDESDKLPPE